MARKSIQKGRSNKQQTRVEIILEPVEIPDPEALRKAFAMIFRKRLQQPTSEESGTPLWIQGQENPNRV
jgi:hypothetical protein